MMKQYARCIADNLHKHNVTNVELYFDVWISLNKRFQQRSEDWFAGWLRLIMVGCLVDLLIKVGWLVAWNKK